MPLALRIWVFAAAAALAVNLGGYPLFDSDEGRNGEVAREMAATNDYVLPRLDGMPYLDKPIVYFAAEAALMEILGPTEVAARLPAYLFTLMTAVVIAWLAKRMWSVDVPVGGEGKGAYEDVGAPRDVGWVAAGIFLSMPLTLAFARTVIFDSALTLFMVIAIAGFYVAIEESNKKGAVVAWIAIGFGIITKGPVAIIVPLLVALPFAIRKKRARVLWPLLGFIGCAAVVAPWVWGVSREVPDFLHYVLVTETAARVATSELQRTGPPWYFVPYVIGGALPWSIAAFFFLRRRRDDATLYLLLWIAIPFLFFSISQSKRPQYILPLMPAIALLVARYWDDARRAVATRVAAAVMLFFGAVLLIAPLFVAQRTKMKPVVAAAVDDVAIPLGICTVVASAAAIALAKRREVALAALALPVMALPLLANPMLIAVGERRSTKSFVEQIRPHLAPETEVIGVEAFTGSVAFYLGRTFPVATTDASEFTSNYLLRRYDRFVDRPETNVRSTAWLRRTIEDASRRRVYIVRNDDEAWRSVLESRGMRQIAEGAHFVAYRN